MRKDITDFVALVKKEFKLEARYFPRNDVYSLRKNGKGVQNFNSRNFYQLPKSFRRSQIRAIIKVGLNHNMGEKTKEQIQLHQAMGKRI
jgi:hypothetical protein